ncbi:MAG: glycosyltransferase family 2 protein [Verrucomicrobia bacterium]|nr:glycosyltransferase family 2 protein [Verrucomicrobiota bacterium]
MTALRFSVVIPFYNEEGNAADLLGEVARALDALGGSGEVLMVNDCSRDGTAAVLDAQAARDPRFRAIHAPRNAGQAASLYRGFLQAQGEYLVTMDGDGQNDPADLPRLFEELQRTGADMIVGIRAARRDSALRKTMSRVANAVRQRILRDGCTDSGCALKIFRREVAQAFIPLKTLYSFLPALAVQGGYRVVQAPVAHRERRAGVSSYGLWVMLWRPLVDLLGMWWFTRRTFPVRGLAEADDPETRPR